MQLITLKRERYFCIVIKKPAVIHTHAARMKIKEHIGEGLAWRFLNRRDVSRSVGIDTNMHLRRLHK